ncbi:MAG: 4Fe-4S dicluster domain-containing protein [Planctomycetes bacterium]|nr:4Fe-4S dicluster domain-containing protein [Planctomycetota bacterium]
MRLDLFLPILRKPVPGKEPSKPGLFSRVVRAVLPKFFFDDTQKIRPGLFRRFLKKVGPVTLSSPFRRATQALCFTAFMAFFFYVCWPYTAQPDPAAVIKLDDNTDWHAHYALDLERKEKVQAEFFLVIDPLVAFSTSIASKTWEWSLPWAFGILGVCILFPRGFCGYLCPLGTLIDCFDWAIGKRVKIFKVKGEGWWVHLKYYILTGIIVSAFFGVLLSGFFAAIPVITRGMLYIVEPFQMGFIKGWHQVPALNAGQMLSIGLFLAVLCLGLLRKRFWCRYVCPSGAVFSVFNVFRATERKVESSCINCNKCVEICPFDAIKADFTTRVADCTLCQSCGGVCPTHSIKFVERWNLTDLKEENDPPVHETPIARRGFLAATAGSLLVVLGMRKAFGAGLEESGAVMPIRPPGSVPEEEFLQMCIRCGECFKACPNHVLQPEGFKQGLEGLWTPEAALNWSGCEPSCNNCGQVCPTGAIRALPLAEKKTARMGLAILNLETCLPHAGKEACQLCVDECKAAGYDAIEFMRVHPEMDQDGNLIEESGFSAPVVVHDRCVGCGLCQTRCNHINVEEKKLMMEAAIIIHAGKGERGDGSNYEDRMMGGSYIALRKKEADKREADRKKFLKQQGVDENDSYVPDFLKEEKTK